MTVAAGLLGCGRGGFDSIMSSAQLSYQVDPLRRRYVSRFWKSEPHGHHISLTPAFLSLTLSLSLFFFFKIRSLHLFFFLTILIIIVLLTCRKQHDVVGTKKKGTSPGFGFSFIVFTGLICFIFFFLMLTMMKNEKPLSKAEEDSTCSNTSRRRQSEGCLV